MNISILAFLYIFSLCLFLPAKAYSVDLTDVATLGADHLELPKNSEIYQHISNLKLDKPFRVANIVLSTSLPSVALEMFGFPEINNEVRSRKIVYAINGEGAIQWVYPISGNIRYVLAKPIDADSIGLLTSGKHGQFIKLSIKGIEKSTQDSDLIFPQSDWGRDFAAYRESILLPVKIEQYYRSASDWFSRPKVVLSGRLYALSDSLYKAEERWNPNLIFAPDFSKNQKSFNEIVSIDNDKDSIIAVLEDKNILIEVDFTNSNKSKEYKLKLAEGEKVIHASYKNQLVATFLNDGQVILWKKSDKTMVELWRFKQENLRAKMKRGSAVITNQNSVLIFYASQSVVKPARKDVLLELELQSGEVLTRAYIPTVASPGGYRAYPF